MFKPFVPSERVMEGRREPTHTCQMIGEEQVEYNGVVSPGAFLITAASIYKTTNKVPGLGEWVEQTTLTSHAQASTFTSMVAMLAHATVFKEMKVEHVQINKTRWMN